MNRAFTSYQELGLATVGLALDSETSSGLAFLTYSLVVGVLLPTLPPKDRRGVVEAVSCLWPNVAPAALRAGIGLDTCCGALPSTVFHCCGPDTGLQA